MKKINIILSLFSIILSCSGPDFTREEIIELIETKGDLNFRAFNLEGINLSYLDLGGANLSGANLSGAKLEGVEGYVKKP